MTLLTALLQAQEVVKIGVLAKRSHAITLQRWSATAEYLSEQIKGFHFEVVPLSFEALSESVENSEVDFVLTNTMYYVELEYMYGISRIATLKNRSVMGIHTNFGGVIITRMDNDALKKASDLKGKRFGAVDINSFGGWIMAKKELLNHGIDVEDFASFEFFGSHDQVVLAIGEGRIDAGTVRTDTLERMDAEGLVNLNDCKVLLPKYYKGFPFRVSTALYPEWPFAKLSSTSQLLSDKVLIALLQMKTDSKAANDAQIAGWTIPLDYSKVHDLLEELHIGPYSELGRLTLSSFYEKYMAWFYIIAAGFAVVFGMLIYIIRLNAALQSSNAKVQQLNGNLEKKVRERTLELEASMKIEKYLKEILKIVTDINELLISSFSSQAVIENSMLRLIKHDPYAFIWFGLVKDNMLHVAYQSKTQEAILDRHTYNMAEGDDNTVFHTVSGAIKLNTTLIEKLPQQYHITIGRDSYNCKAEWMIVIPLRNSDNEAPIGSMALFSSRTEGFDNEEIKILENLAMDIGMTMAAIERRSKLETMELEKVSNYEETILAFVNIIEQRDSYTAGHTLRVAKYSRLIAKEMGIDEQQITVLEKASILHDIGKVVTPDAILLKPGRLSQLEYELIKQHVNAGFLMLSKIDMYKDLAQIIRFHHARYDGKGYPPTPSKNPDAIPMLSHIMAVADAFDAMTSNRIYKVRKDAGVALEEIKDFSGTQFHPHVAAAAAVALKAVDIVDTHQLPQNELESRRFAYFFLDPLTECYNENYLRMLLNKREDDQRCLNIIDIKDFAQFNRSYGWEKGDQFLIQFANSLRGRFHDATLFRYHGDQFVLLFETHRDVKQSDFAAFGLTHMDELNIDIAHYDLHNAIPDL